MRYTRILHRSVAFALCATALVCVHGCRPAHAKHVPGVAYYYQAVETFNPPDCPSGPISEQEARRSADGYYVAYFDSQSHVVRVTGYHRSTCDYAARYWRGADGKLDSVVYTADYGIMPPHGGTAVELFDQKGHYTGFVRRPRIPDSASAVSSPSQPGAQK
jgi:hypothetical protein